MTEVLRGRGVADADVVAEAAIAALFDWRDINTGERCRCRCHPQLPETDLHDYGASCQCTRTDEERRASFRQALNDIREYWESPDSKRLQAANHEAEEALQTWLAQHPGVVVHSHGGWAPEQWTGQVDGHSFYFRERGGDWHLELDLQPTGHIEGIHGHNDDGTPQYRPQPLEQGDIIATGTTYTDGYGNTSTERAQFIVTTIRDHLTDKPAPTTSTNSTPSRALSEHPRGGVQRAELTCTRVDPD